MYTIQMRDMALTPDEIEERSAPVEMDDPSEMPKYPYGLCICLDQDMLEKLGIVGEDGKPDIPEVGDMIHLFAMATVTSVSQNQRADGSNNCRVELQITHLGLEDEDDENEEADMEE